MNTALRKGSLRTNLMLILIPFIEALRKKLDYLVTVCYTYLVFLKSYLYST